MSSFIPSFNLTTRMGSQRLRTGQNSSLRAFFLVWFNRKLKAEDDETVKMVKIAEVGASF